jgi:lipoyl(octanoyl) transferase
VLIRRLGRREYLPTWQAMMAFTDGRDDETRDELWLVEHPGVFTQGRAGRPDHVLDPGPIPVIQVDRGGQVTYHGPGQAVVYLLIDLGRRRLSVRAFVQRIEQAVIDLLDEVGVAGSRRPGAPGVYVGPAKIASLGLRVRRGRSYHGLALNVDMDLAPFRRINPCGQRGLPVTQLRDLGVAWNLGTAWTRLAAHLIRSVGYRRPRAIVSAPEAAPPPGGPSRTAPGDPGSARYREDAP